MRADGDEAVLLQQLCDALRLIAAVLHDQPAAVTQVRRRACGDRRQGLEPGGPVAEGDRGLRRQTLKRRIGGGHIGRIGDDQSKRSPAQRCEPITQAPVDARESEFARVLHRDLERRG